MIAWPGRTMIRPAEPRMRGSDPRRALYPQAYLNSKRQLSQPPQSPRTLELRLDFGRKDFQLLCLVKERREQHQLGANLHHLTQLRYAFVDRAPHRDALVSTIAAESLREPAPRTLP